MVPRDPPLGTPYGGPRTLKFKKKLKGGTPLKRGWAHSDVYPPS